MLGSDGATDGRVDGLLHLHPADEDDIKKEGSANLKSTHGHAAGSAVEATPDEQGEDKSVEAHGDPVLQAELKVPLGEVPYLPGQRDHIWAALPSLA